MKNIDIAMRSHTNMSMFEAIIGICQSGGFHATVGSNRAITRIITIAEQEQRKLFKMHNEALLAEELKEQA